MFDWYGIGTGLDRFEYIHNDNEPNCEFFYGSYGSKSLLKTTFTFWVRITQNTPQKFERSFCSPKVGSITVSELFT